MIWNVEELYKLMGGEVKRQGSCLSALLVRAGRALCRCEGRKHLTGFLAATLWNQQSDAGCTSRNMSHAHLRTMVSGAGMTS